MAIQLVFVIVCGGNIFLRYRFLSALYPFACLLMGWGVEQFSRKRKLRFQGDVLMVLAIIAVISQVEYEGSGRNYWKTRLTGLGQYQQFHQFFRERLKGLGARPPTLNAKLGILLRDKFPEGTLIATGQIGQIGYYSRLPVLDMVGLADYTLAHEGVSLNYLLERGPEVFLLLGSRFLQAAPNVGVYSGLLGTDAFRKQYAWRRIYFSDPTTETFYWIQRRQTPLKEAPRVADRHIDPIIINLY